MYKRCLTIGLPLLTLAFWFQAQPTQGFTATFQSITPDATNITDQLDLPDDIQAAGFSGTLDQAYTAVFSVDESPALVVLPGGDMTADENWSYDETAGTVTVNFTARGVNNDDVDLPESTAIFVVAFVGVAEDGQDGPPPEMTGAWLTTDIMSWSLIPPSEEAPYFGFSLTGTSGTAGYFNMFIPDAVVNLIGQMLGRDLTIEDLAVFENNDQSSLAITEVDGGGLVEIDVTFTDDATSPQTAVEGEVTKEITTGAQLPVSLSATKYSVDKGDNSKLYGWLKNGKKNQEVTVWRKLKGQDTYTKIETLVTEQDGYFSTKLTIKKTAKYKIKYKKDTSSTTKVSPVQQITVE